MNDREKCIDILDEIDVIFKDIKIQWNKRRYSSLSVLKKINGLGKSVADFKFFYLKYLR